MSDTQIFANLEIHGSVMTARIVGPNLGDREGNIVSTMIQNELAGRPGTVKYVVLDFSNVAYINSAGLGACVSTQKFIKAAKATAVLYNVRPDIEAVFKMVKLDKLFKLAPDESKLAKITG